VLAGFHGGALLVSVPETSRQMIRCRCGRSLFKARGQGREIEIPCPRCKRLLLLPAATNEVIVLEERPGLVVR
jgi:phage FluMu protein Com